MTLIPLLLRAVAAHHGDSFNLALLSVDVLSAGLGRTTMRIGAVGKHRHDPGFRIPGLVSTSAAERLVGGPATAATRSSPNNVRYWFISYRCFGIGDRQEYRPKLSLVGDTRRSVKYTRGNDYSQPLGRGPSIGAYFAADIVSSNQS